jgi:hypothetical protein
MASQNKSSSAVHTSTLMSSGVKTRFPQCVVASFTRNEPSACKPHNTATASSTNPGIQFFVAAHATPAMPVANASVASVITSHSGVTLRHKRDIASYCWLLSWGYEIWKYGSEVYEEFMAECMKQVQMYFLPRRSLFVDE